MKRISVIAIILFSFNTVQSQAKFKDVTKAAEALRVAMVDADVNMLSQLTDDSLTYGHSSGHIDNKQEFIEKLKTGKSDFVSIEITDQHVQLFGNTALIRHTLSAVTNDNGKPGTVKLYILLVWKKKDHTWKLIARQAVKTG